MQKSLVLRNFFPAHFSTAKARKPLALNPVKPFWRRISIVLIIFNIFLSLSYLLGVNSYASTGYEIKKFQNRLSYLTEENKKLNVKVAENSSIFTVENEFLEEFFVSVGTPEFLQINQYTQK